MPKYQIELDDGRKFEVESDVQPTEQDILSSIGETDTTRTTDDTQVSDTSDGIMSPLGAFLVGAQRSIGSTAGGIAGGALGGAGAGAVFGPVGSVAGAIGGGIAGSFAGSKLQETVESSVLPDEWNEKLYEWAKTAEAEQPVAFSIGQFAPGAVAFRPSVKNIKDAVSFAREISKNPKAIGTLIKDPVNTAKVSNLMNVGFGTIMEGGRATAEELFDDKEGIDLVKIAANAAGGALLSEPTKIGRFLSFDNAFNLKPGETVADRYKTQAERQHELHRRFVDDTIDLKGVGESSREYALNNRAKLNEMSNEAQASMEDLHTNILPKALEEMNLRNAQAAAGSGLKPKVATLDDFNKQLQEYATAKNSIERMDVQVKRGAIEKSPYTRNSAKLKIQEIEQLSHFNRIKEAHDAVVSLGKKSLQLAKENGLISDSDYKFMSDSYSNWVSFKRIHPDAEFADFVKTARSGSKKPFKKQVGSELEVGDIVANTFNVHNSVLKAIHDNNMMKFIAKEAMTPNSKAAGVVKVHKGIGKDGTTRPQNIVDKINVVPFKMDGQTHFLEIADKNTLGFLTGAFKEQLPSSLRALSTLNRGLSSLMTKLNPAFAPMNLIRDVADMVINHSANTDSLRSGASTLKRLPEAFKAVLDHVRGIKSVGSDIVVEMKKNGVEFGGVPNADQKQAIKTIDEMRKMATNKAYRNLNNLSKAISNFNEVFENATRVSAYMESKSKGATAQEAGRLAREATVPFNRRGTMANQMGAIWLFYNASVQGMGRTIKSLQNPKVLAATVGTLAGVATTLHNYNKFVDEDYESKVFDYDKKNNFVIALGTGDDGKFRYISIPIAWGIKPIYNSARSLAKITAGEQVDPKKEIDDIGSSFVQAYNPFGGSQSFLEAFTPSVAAPLVDVYANKSWTGGKIRPEGFIGSVSVKDIPASENYYSGLRKNFYGRLGIGISSGMAKAGVETNPNDIRYLVEQYTGGLGRFIDRTLSTGTSIIKGKLPETRNVPFLSSFLKEKYEDVIPTINEVDVSNPDALQKSIQKENVRRVRVERDAYDAYLEAAKIKDENKQDSYIAKIQEKDPAMAQRVITLLEKHKTGLDDMERKLKALPVKDGSRANAIIRYIEQDGDADRIATWLEHLREKKIISQEVDRQISNTFTPSR